MGTVSDEFPSLYLPFSWSNITVKRTANIASKQANRGWAGCHTTAV